MSLKDATQCQNGKLYDVNMGNLSVRFSSIAHESVFIGWQQMADATGDVEVIAAVKELREALDKANGLVRARMRVRS